MKKAFLSEIIIIVVCAAALAASGIYAFHLRSELAAVEQEKVELEEECRESDILIVGYMYLYKIRRYHDDHGSYPATLQDLAPTYISQRYIDKYTQYWVYTPNLENDTFELIEVVDDPSAGQGVFSPEFYGIYNKVCVERILKQRQEKEEGQKCTPTTDAPCAPLD